MKSWALINKETNIVENNILWDGVTEWTPPENCFVVEWKDGIQIEWIYDPSTGTFTDPNPPALPEETPSPAPEPTA